MENRYIITSAYVVNVLNPLHLIGGTKDWIRENLAGNRYLVEVTPDSPYYNLSFTKTKAEALEIVEGPEWNTLEEPWLNE